MARKAVATTTTPKKRKVSHKGAKQKGNAAESLLVKTLNELGIPTVKVLGSGKFEGAGADVKVGVPVKPDGTLPGPDESDCLHYAEVKHHASFQDRYFEELNSSAPIIVSEHMGVETFWTWYNQNKRNNVVAIRRAKAPPNAHIDQVLGVFMPVTEYANLLKLAYPDRVYYHHPKNEEV